MLVKDQTFVSFDLETTGLSPFNDRIIEIGMTKFNLRAKILDSASILINPESLIPENVVNIHHITDDMVKNSPTFDAVYSDVIKFFSDTILIAHNAPFDISFFMMSCDRYHLDYPSNKVIDTLELSRRRFPELKKFNLESLVETFQCSSPPDHRALNDSMAAYEVFLKLVEDYESLPIEKYFSANPCISFDTKTLGWPSDYKDKLLVIERAIEEKKNVHFTYRNNKGEVLDRDVKPYIIAPFYGSLSLSGYCFLRQEERLFKLERIISISVKEGEAS